MTHSNLSKANEVREAKIFKEYEDRLIDILFDKTPLMELLKDEPIEDSGEQDKHLWLEFED